VVGSQKRNVVAKSMASASCTLTKRASRSIGQQKGRLPRERETVVGNKLGTTSPKDMFAVGGGLLPYGNAEPGHQ
jgi:hypothetical protein